MTSYGANHPPHEYDGPPDYRVVGRHAVFPEMGHDEIERLNFLAQMNRHLSTRVVPDVRTAYETRVAPAFARANGRPIADRHEARRAMLADPVFCTWSALRRLTTEQRQQAGRWTVLRQAEHLAARTAALTDGDDRLSLDPALPIPRYVSAVDHHCMPGSYHVEVFPGDVSAGANYDHGGFVSGERPRPMPRKAESTTGQPRRNSLVSPMVAVISDPLREGARLAGILLARTILPVLQSVWRSNPSTHAVFKD